MSACNRYVALVQCCHVPLVVVFSANVLVGHVFRCSLVPSFHVSVSGTLGCFPGVDNSKGFFLEPVSVAPSLRVFSLKSYDLHASVRALAEIASGGFETDSNGTLLLPRCDMCGLTQFGSCPYGGLTSPGSCPCLEFLFFAAMLAALPDRCALCGLTRSGSRPSCGLTRRGSCPCFQFIFVFVMFAALLLHRALSRLFRFGSCPSCGFTLLVGECDAPIPVHVAGLCVLDAGCSRSIISCWSVQSKKTKLWEAYLFEALCAVFSPGHWARIRHVRDFGKPFSQRRHHGWTWLRSPEFPLPSRFFVGSRASINFRDLLGTAHPVLKSLLCPGSPSFS